MAVGAGGWVGVLDGVTGAAVTVKDAVSVGVRVAWGWVADACCVTTKVGVVGPGEQAERRQSSVGENF